MLLFINNCDLLADILFVVVMFNLQLLKLLTSNEFAKFTPLTESKTIEKLFTASSTIKYSLDVSYCVLTT